MCIIVLSLNYLLKGHFARILIETAYQKLDKTHLVETYILKKMKIKFKDKFNDFKFSDCLLQFIII